MGAPYLEELESAFRAGARDLYEAAQVAGITFESACLTFNNGLLKGYWAVALPESAEYKKEKFINLLRHFCLAILAIYP